MNSSKRKVLVLGGHLDDSILAVGGIIRKFTRAGHHVAVMCFGNGDEGFAQIEDRDTCVAKFKAEAIEAHKILGVTDFICHDLPDFAVQENRETYRQCIEAIRRVQPDIILGHAKLEYFQHHAMSRLSADAWWQAGWACSADLGKPWVARSLYHFEVLHTMPEPSHLVDVSDTFADKLAAWAKFDTCTSFLGSQADILEARARFHGSRIGVKYAEALTRSNFVPATVRNAVEEL